jgi:hypothetical protein
MSDSGLTQSEIDQLLDEVEKDERREDTDLKYELARTAKEEMNNISRHFDFAWEAVDMTVSSIKRLIDGISEIIKENANVDIGEAELKSIAEQIYHGGWMSLDPDSQTRKVLRRNSSGMFSLIFYCYNLLDKLMEIQGFQPPANNVLSTVRGLGEEEFGEYLK